MPGYGNKASKKPKKYRRAKKILPKSATDKIETAESLEAAEGRMPKPDLTKKILGFLQKKTPPAK